MMSDNERTYTAPQTAEELLKRYGAGERYFPDMVMRYGAKLSDAILSRADLYAADLSGADLRAADLSGADLRAAILSGACLDPDNRLSCAALREAGFELEWDSEASILWAYGWRTRRSKYVGNTEYVPGQTYRADVFSLETTTECHPGLYLCPTREAALEWDKDVVRVKCDAVSIVKAGAKYRTPMLIVLETEIE